MAKFVGDNVYVSFAGSVISGDQTEWDDHEEAGKADASAGADAARTYLTTLLDGTGTINAKYSVTGTAATYIYNLCAPGTEGTLIVGPEGTATGKPKKTVVARVDNRDRKMPYDDVVTLTIDFQWSQATAPTDGVW